jgi:hypothetical protein
VFLFGPAQAFLLKLVLVNSYLRLWDLIDFLTASRSIAKY